jgi:repressor LexA
MASFSERLRYLRQKKNYTQRDIADKLGISESAYGFYEQGRREPSNATLSQLSLIFEVTTDYILGIANNTKSSDGTFPLGTLRDIPIVAEIPCGMPIFTETNIIGSFPVDTSIINLNGGEYVWVKAKGDSMIMANIFGGSLVLLRLQPEVESGDIAAVCVDSENATLKRVIYGEGTVKLVPENPSMDDMVYDRKRVRVVGKAVFVGTKI